MKVAIISLESTFAMEMELYQNFSCIPKRDFVGMDGPNIPYFTPKVPRTLTKAQSMADKYNIELWFSIPVKPGKETSYAPRYMIDLLQRT